jgi:L-alanine-DL-glutamate epimerase-like enolase superfamily enzyme
MARMSRRTEVAPAQVRSWSLHPVRLPYRRNVAWASFTATHADFMILRIQADDGAVGVAEVNVNPRWFGTTFRTLTASLEEIFLPMLAGLERPDSASFAQAARGIPEHMSAKALVDNALWDLASAAGGEPFWKARGEKSPDVSWILTRQSPQLMAEEAAGMVERYGFRTLKLKGGQGLDVDIEAIRAVRAAAGNDPAIFLDCNGYYSPAEAPDYLAAVAAEGVVAVEDAYRLDADDDFRRIQAASALPIALDARCPTLRDAQRFCKLGAKAIALKPGRVGLTETFAMTDLARTSHCAAHLSSTVETELGSLAALGSSMRMTEPRPWLAAETTFFLMYGERITLDPVTIAGGRIELPDVPSLAELIDWERVERLRA